MSGQSISNFKTQLKELIYSLFSIAPSRNSISRLIMLLPLDEKIANQMYPELADRHMMEYLRLAIGLKRFDSNIEMGWDTLAVYIRDFIGNFAWVFVYCAFYPLLACNGNRLSYRALRSVCETSCLQGRFDCSSRIAQTQNWYGVVFSGFFGRHKS